MDVTLPLIGAALSLASAIAGYRTGKKRRPIDHTKELNRVGLMLGVPRLRGESNASYAARLVEFMQAEME